MTARLPEEGLDPPPTPALTLHLLVNLGSLWADACGDVCLLLSLPSVSPTIRPQLDGHLRASAYGCPSLSPSVRGGGAVFWVPNATGVP